MTRFNPSVLIKIVAPVILITLAAGCRTPEPRPPVIEYRPCADPDAVAWPTTAPTDRLLDRPATSVSIGEAAKLWYATAVLWRGTAEALRTELSGCR